MSDGPINVRLTALDQYATSLANPIAAMATATGFGTSEGPAVTPSAPGLLPAGDLLKSRHDAALAQMRALFTSIHAHVTTAQTVARTIHRNYGDTDGHQAQEMSLINTDFGTTGGA